MKVMVVLGAGRSATSAVAKGLHLAGFPMGDPLLGANVSQPEGHYEHIPLIELNDRMLADLGGTWMFPPDTEKVEQAKHLVSHASAYIAGRGAGQWGMKDPRMVLLWPVWAAAFREHDHDLVVVRVCRDSRLVAESLARRDGCKLHAAISLTDAYVRRLELWTGLEH